MNTYSSRNSSVFNALLPFIFRIVDAGIIWLTLVVVVRAFDVFQPEIYQPAFFLAVIFYLLIAEPFSLFKSLRLENYADITAKILIAWSIVSLLLILIAVLTKSAANFSRIVVLTWLCVTPVILTLVRLSIYAVLRNLRAHALNTRTYAILGNSEGALSLPKKIIDIPWTGLAFAGQYQELESLLERLQYKKIDYIFIGYSENEPEKIAAAMKALGDSTASTYLIPDVLLSDLLGSQWVMLGNTPLILINDHPFYGGAWALKKLEDLILGTLILLLISPMMLLIALAIKLSSPGPVLFKQRRNGLNGEIITVYKFRTMNTLEDGDVIIQATKDDPRITPIGKFLRRSSLDELPQFFNVLQGTMSIVGPRPHALSHNEHYRKRIDGYMQRHKVKPGITGWAQVNGFRGETDTLDKMQSRIDYDLYYINHWSIGLDLKIILLTIINGLFGKTAY